jgi:hypothetical protein
VHFNLSLSEREGLDLMININSAPGSRKPRFIGVVRSTTILLACASPALGLVAEPGQACDHSSTKCAINSPVTWRTSEKRS